MKLLSSCIVFLAALAWSNMFNVSGGILFEKGYLNIDTTKTCNVDTSYINCSLEKGLAYYSTLDTNFAVFAQPRFASLHVAIPRTDIAASAANSHTITQVLRYEFMNWVEWGFIDLTKDSAQRLIDRLLPESENMENRSINHKKVCDTDPSQCPNWGPYGGGSGGGISDEEANRLPQKKVLLNNESGNSDRTFLKQESRMTNQGMWGVFPGMGYKVFDANGVYLYRGTWQGKFDSRGRTEILKFDNGRTAVFR